MGKHELQSKDYDPHGGADDMEEGAESGELVDAIRNDLYGLAWRLFQDASKKYTTRGYTAKSFKPVFADLESPMDKDVYKIVERAQRQGNDLAIYSAWFLVSQQLLYANDKQIMEYFLYFVKHSNMSPEMMGSYVYGKDATELGSKFNNTELQDVYKEDGIEFYSPDGRYRHEQFLEWATEQGHLNYIDFLPRGYYVVWVPE